jgi:hypothetical protein
MRDVLLCFCFALLPLLSGCAATDAMIPHLRKPISWTDSARRAQQDAYDRSVANSMGATRNGVRTGLMGTSNYIPGASSNPFAP